jgi:hypothetical protein
VKPHVGIQKDVTVVEGERLKLECIVLGKPSPEVSWTFGKYPLVNLKLTAWLLASV